MKSNSYSVSGQFDANGNYVGDSYQPYDYGYRYILDVDGSLSLIGTMSFGYMRVLVGGGFTWQVNLTPIFNSSGFWTLYAGIGIGLCCLI